MEISAVLLARFFAFIETYDLNPRGRAHFPAMMDSLVERYGFAKFPQKLEDFDESKGVIFQAGRSGKVGIAQVQIFDHAIYVDTTSSTEDSEKFLLEALTWLSEKHGLNFRPEMIKRKTYVSQLSFLSDVVMDAVHPAVLRLADKLTKRVPEFFDQPLHYVPMSFAVGYDPLSVKTGPAIFSIDRRADTLFKENKFFSSAPLPTEEHIQFLKELEANLKA